MLQHVAMYCSATLQHTCCQAHPHRLTALGGLQHTAARCNALQRTAAHCNDLLVGHRPHTAIHYNTLPQHTATHWLWRASQRECLLWEVCHTLQHKATRCNTLQDTATIQCKTLAVECFPTVTQSDRFRRGSDCEVCAHHARMHTSLDQSTNHD